VTLERGDDWAVRSDLPTGTVTFLFTDIEGSTKLLHELGADAYADALAEHRRIVRGACAAEGGVEVDTQGDAFFLAFSTSREAVCAAQAITDGLSSGPITLRIGLHTGTPLVTDEGYVGEDVHLAARVTAAGHGGQILLSRASRELVDGHPITDLGEHRLKDIEEAVSIYQLGAQRFPPLRTISNTNLPRPASSFVGRQRERDELVSMLSNGARLLTLSGPGGSGKTRLAIEVASELIPAFKAGVFWVALAVLRDPALVTQTIGQTLGASGDLATHIGDRELLLVLDNFEQVAAAAPELSQLLECCPNVSILVTSRELLRIAGEVDYSVPPLAAPEAVELFCVRSRLEADESVAQLCRRLDDLPLAIELAAARTHVLTPAQILERLGRRLDLLRGGRDTDPRQQTLRATIAWSHDLLDPAEQRLFARLAVFAGGCTLESAEAVCDAGLDQLQSLVEKSLLRHTTDRFWMLETIREFAGEKLADLAEVSEVLERYARWYLALIKAARFSLMGADAAEHLKRLDPELENFRGAIAWAAANDPEAEVELVKATRYFLHSRGYVPEVLGYATHALETAESASLDKRELLYAVATQAHWLGDNASSQRWAEVLLEVARAHGDRFYTTQALNILAWAARAQGDTERARMLLLEAAEPARLLLLETPEPSGTEADDHTYRNRGIPLINVHHELGNMALESGETQTARTHFQEKLEAARQVSNPAQECSALACLGTVDLSEGDTDAAADHLKSALRLVLELRQMDVIFNECLLPLAEVALRRKELARAARLLGATDAARERAGWQLDRGDQDRFERVMAALADDDTLQAALVQGRAMDVDDAVAYALGEPRGVRDP
jgi:predicted ATPase/class 3 adenylate cyclase